MRAIAIVAFAGLLGCHSGDGLNHACTKNGQSYLHSLSENGSCASDLVCDVADDCVGGNFDCPGVCVRLCTDESGCVLADGGVPSTTKCCYGDVTPENGGLNGPATYCACFHSP